MRLEDQVVAWLAQQELPIYLVGGTVRDRLLGRPVYDLDLAVAGNGLVLARRLADRFKGAYYPLDEARSTGRAILCDDAGRRLVVDVARLRGIDASGSLPIQESLASDLDDRDFTINALAADICEPDEIIDRHGGLDDLAARLIRPVSDEAIGNDPVRALRAVRLAASLQFALAPETEVLIRRDGAALVQVSYERIRDELVRLLTLPRAAGYLTQLDNLGLLTAIFPELESLRGTAQSPPHALDALSHSLETVRGLEAVLGALDDKGKVGAREEGPKTNDRRDIEASGPETSNLESPGYSLSLQELAPYAERLMAHLDQRLGEERPRLVALKLAALLHDTGKPVTQSLEAEGRIRFIGHEAESVRIATGALRRLRFNRGEVRLAGTVIRHHSRPLQLAGQRYVSPRSIYRFFRDTDEAGVDVLLHTLADYRAKDPWGAEDDLWFRLLSLVARMLSDFYERPEERIAPPLLLNGNDLIREFGLQPGPQIRELLEAVREAQVSGRVHTRKEAMDLVHRKLIASR